jgi:hypothetical protein
LRGMGRGWGDVLRHSVQNIFEDAGVGRKGIASCRRLPVEPRVRCGQTISKQGHSGSEEKTQMSDTY